MSDFSTIITAVVVAAVPGILAWVQSWRNAGKIQDIHISLNSRLDQLLKARGEAGRAEGVAQEKQEQQGRDEKKVNGINHDLMVVKGPKF